VLFVATGSALDEEMAARIAVHQSTRPASWRTVEVETQVAAAVRASGPARVVLLDCLTLLASNVLMERDEAEPDTATGTSAADRLNDEITSLLETRRASGAHLIVVSNEVGMGIVPPYPVGRLYRDILGAANQRLAAEADAVYLMVAGLPVEIKSLARFTPF
jgi:adenosylcobinamide kinase/adenosylcobinamide-phosphate guanylyltransferase